MIMMMVVIMKAMKMNIYNDNNINDIITNNNVDIDQANNISIFGEGGWILIIRCIDTVNVETKKEKVG